MMVAGGCACFAFQTAAVAGAIFTLLPLLLPLQSLFTATAAPAAIPNCLLLLLLLMVLAVLMCCLLLQPHRRYNH